jgi:hypothetical protein
VFPSRYYRYNYCPYKAGKETRMMFENRHGHMVVLKRTLGGETIVQTISKASVRALNRKMGKLYAQQEKKLHKAPKLLNSDEEYEQHRADNENNLVKGE